MTTLETQSRMVEKTEGEVGVPTDPGEAAAQGLTQSQKVRGTEIGQIASLDVAPDLLDRVELGRVGGQALDLEPTALPSQIRRHAVTFVGGQPVPEEDDTLGAKVALEGPQELDQAAVGVGARPGVEIDAATPTRPAKGERGRDRQALPQGAGVSQDRRLAARCPRPADDRLVREATFVLEEEPGAPTAGVFFTCGQRVRFHRAIAASSRSRAWRVGRWTDQFRARSRYQT